MQVSPLLPVVVVVVVVRAYECETEEEAETDRAGSFTAALWHWPGHTVHYTFAGSCVVWPSQTAALVSCRLGHQGGQENHPAGDGRNRG